MDHQFDFDQLDSFIPGALGEPGQRVFYLQARRGQQVVSFRCDVAFPVLRVKPSPDPERDIAGLIEPVVPEWIIGTISVGVDEATGVIQVTTEELVPEEIEIVIDDELTEEDIEDLLDEPPTGAMARFTLRIAQAAAFAEAAEELVTAGRPPCRLCGRPIGAEGHACPRWN